LKDFLNKYIENQCSDEEFESTIDFLLKKNNWLARDSQMKEHWRQITSEGDHPDLSGTLYKIHYHLKIQIDFFEPVLTPDIRQKIFNRGQFGLTPVKNIYSIDFVSSLIKKEQVLL
jgi:hypothetical protein